MFTRAKILNVLMVVTAVALCAITSACTAPQSAISAKSFPVYSSQNVAGSVGSPDLSVMDY